MARFRGPVGEVDDPLTWGLDLDEETLTGIAARDTEPVQERFLRSYLSFAGETVDVETLRVLPDDDESAIDVVRTSLSAALAAPLQGDTSGGVPGADDDAFVDSYAEYRAAMRAIVEEVEAVTPERVTFVVDGAARECLRLSLRTSTAVLVTVEDRALVVAGPRDLLDRVDVVTRPLRSILHGET
ncbi:hypothetical protein IF650_04185 [Cellulosimicrobium terreum]|nr:hypothetical protein [Cellulosimicrobium terreum]